MADAHDVMAQAAFAVFHGAGQPADDLQARGIQFFDALAHFLLERAALVV